MRLRLPMFACKSAEFRLFYLFVAVMLFGIDAKAGGVGDAASAISQLIGQYCSSMKTGCPYSGVRSQPKRVLSSTNVDFNTQADTLCIQPSEPGKQIKPDSVRFITLARSEGKFLNGGNHPPGVVDYYRTGWFRAPNNANDAQAMCFTIFARAGSKSHSEFLEGMLVALER